ncbi:MAG: hypothetical protein K6U74_07040 [Firmicutes bacterium]|nr:hypothetical protein [Bacillota bacterium]
MKTMSDIDIAALKEQLRREIMEEIMNYRRVSDDTPWAQVKKYMTERFELAGLQRTANHGIDVYNAATALVKQRLGIRHVTQIRADQVPEAREVIDRVFEIVGKGGAA